MRILHTSELYAPSVGGAQEVVRQISERLAKRGHEVTVATTRLEQRREHRIAGVKIEEFSVTGNAVRGFRGETGRYLEFLRNGKFDVMLNYAAQQWTADLAFEVLDQVTFQRVFAPCGFSALHLPAYAAYFSRMPEVLRRYDRVIFHSLQYQDAQFALEHGLTNIAVIPNGAAAEEFGTPATGFRQRYRIPANVPLLLTIGTHTGLKGHDLVIRAFSKARLGPSVLMIIGNRPPRIGCWPACKLRAAWLNVGSRGEKRVLVVDPPRADVVAALAAADVFVFGSAVECAPLVLYEAMAAGTPFLSVSCGNAAEIAQLGGGRIMPSLTREDGTVVADPAIVAEWIEQMVADAPERARMGHRGKEVWRSHHEWEQIVSQYESLYEQLVRSDCGRVV